MNKEIENKIISILDEQVALENIEAFAGNEVKRNFHKGAIFGIKLIIDTIVAPNQSLDADGSIPGDEETFNNGQGW